VQRAKTESWKKSECRYDWAPEWAMDWASERAPSLPSARADVV